MNAGDWSSELTTWSESNGDAESTRAEMLRPSHEKTVYQTQPAVPGGRVDLPSLQAYFPRPG
jgi:hypothetical protein